jgi:Na+/phosphate symporter
LATPRLVGTEIAHAVPLTLVAGLGHASMGNLDLELLGQLLMGLFLEFILEYVEWKSA